MIFRQKSTSGILAYGLATADGYIRRTESGYPEHRFPAGSIGMFIRSTAGVTDGCGIVLVDDKLLYVSFDEIDGFLK